jgi:hypothetical protein
VSVNLLGKGESIWGKLFISTSLTAEYHNITMRLHKTKIERQFYLTLYFYYFYSIITLFQG